MFAALESVPETCWLPPVVAEISTGKFCRLFGPVSASSRVGSSFGVIRPAPVIDSERRISKDIGLAQNGVARSRIGLHLRRHFVRFDCHLRRPCRQSDCSRAVRQQDTVTRAIGSDLPCTWLPTEVHS